MLTLVRRVVAAFGLTGLIATLFRLRGRGGVPPQTGGWRELTEAELVDVELIQAELDQAELDQAELDQADPAQRNGDGQRHVRPVQGNGESFRGGE